MNREALEHMADRIEMVLARSETPARIAGGIVTPRAIRFNVAPMPGVSLARIAGAVDDLTAELGVEARIVRNGVLAIEVRRVDAPSIILADLLSRLPALPLGTALLGIADDGAPLLVRLPSIDVGHVLITGASACGKTSLLRTLAASLAATHTPRQLRLVLIGGGLDAFRGLPYALNASLPVLFDQVAERTRRNVRSPLIVLALDDLTGIGERALTDLLRDGPGVGIHVIAASREALTGWPVRIVGLGESGYFEAQTRSGVITRFTAAQLERDTARALTVSLLVAESVR